MRTLVMRNCFHLPVTEPLLNLSCSFHLQKGKDHNQEKRLYCLLMALLHSYECCGLC